MNERIAIIDGVRTPFCKAGGQLRDVSADHLGAVVAREILLRTGITGDQIDEVIFGNVAQPSNAANIARVVALRAGLPQRVPAYTVHRNCASGMEAITTAANKILAGEAEIILAGGTESMSNIPLMFNKKMTRLFEELGKAKTTGQKFKALMSFRLGHLSPVVGVVDGLTDPICGLIMGLTAEKLSREFGISRQVQDQYALESHLKAAAAIQAGRFNDEMIPLPVPPQFKSTITVDDGPRASQTIEALQKLKPYFDRKNGTVTVGNACPLTDGAAAVVVMKESKAKAMGLTPIGYLKAYGYAGLEPERMGLGPIYASTRALQSAGMTVADMDLFEINEAFSAQVLANVRAFESAEFAQQKLGRSTALGAIDPTLLNVNGGAVALGHPVGTSGTRIMVTLLKELKRRGKNRGLASLCIGGGQGGAAIVEVE
ncbi:thiolase family protein [bacterium]|nr:thiolase family protein [bacterium]